MSEEEKDPVIRFYYNSEGRAISWYKLTEGQQEYWRRKYHQTQDRARRTLNKIRSQGPGSPRHG